MSCGSSWGARALRRTARRCVRGRGLYRRAPSPPAAAPQPCLCPRPPSLPLQVRLERVQEELRKLREAAGQVGPPPWRCRQSLAPSPPPPPHPHAPTHTAAASQCSCAHTTRAPLGPQSGLPNFDQEDSLREEASHLAAQNAGLSRQLAALTAALTSLAAGAEGSAIAAAAAPMEQEGDIVLEFPSPDRGGAVADEADGALGAAARRAVEDIRAAQARAARGIADREQQLRLLQESQRLNRLRRASIK